MNFKPQTRLKKVTLLTSDFRTAKKIDHELDELKLPSLTKVKEEFLGLCEQLRV